MELNGHHRKWPTSGTRCVRMENILILFSTMCVFSVMMLLKVEMYSGSTVLWSNEYEPTMKSPVIRQMAMPAMKTIVAYSPEKQVEMDRKYPVYCPNSIGRPQNSIQEGSWQEVSAGGVSVYSGYYDDRMPNHPYLRILAVTNGTPAEELGPLYCQTWNDDQIAKKPQAIEATIISIWWKEWDPGTKDAVTPLLISCPLNEPKKSRFHVSISASPCEKASNVLAVETEAIKEYERNFTVCVKDMRFYHDISDRLIEWFELLKLLGAEKVDVYVAQVPKLVQRVLRYYSESGLVNMRAAPRQTADSLWQRRRDHLLAYNDCLYRNLKTSRYVVPLDVDEVIVPREEESWSRLLTRLYRIENKAPGAASLAVSNAFFFDAFSEERIYQDERTPHTLRHLWRSSLVSPVPQYSKSFVSTSRALTVFNHYALSALAGAERARAVPVEMALLHHYKAACRPALVDCHQYTTSTVKDETLLRLANHLITNVNKVLDTI